MKNWFNLTVAETAKELGVDLEKGLEKNEIALRQEKYGKNQIQGKKKKGLIIKFLEQFKDFMIIILIIAAIVSGIIGIQEGEGITDTIIILIVVIVNAIIGVAQENKAEKSLEEPVYTNHRYPLPHTHAAECRRHCVLTTRTRLAAQ